MNSLLIILLGTVLIQSSAIAAGKVITDSGARGIFNDEFRTAAFTLLTLTLSALLGYGLSKASGVLQLNHLYTPVLLAGLSCIFMICRMALTRVPGAVRWPVFIVHLTNQSAMLGMAIYSADYLETPAEALGYGLGASVLLAILNACFNALRQRIDCADVPLAFRGIPIALITAGFMALGLLGFAGMVRN